MCKVLPPPNSTRSPVIVLCVLPLRPYPSSEEEYPEEKPDGSIWVEVLEAEAVKGDTVLLGARKAELFLAGDTRQQQQ